MSRLDGWRHRLYVLLKGDAYLDEIRRELHFHRELDTLSRDGATIGNETYYREEVRRMTPLSWLDRIRQDATYAIRGLRRSPGFTIAVILTLGLGVGVNGAMFSLLSRLYVLPPSGVARPNEVRRLYENFLNRPGERVYSAQFQYPQYAALRAAVDPSIPLGILNASDSVSLRDGDARIPARVSYVNRDFFSVLGVHPIAGRSFAPEEDRIETSSPVMIISDALWQRAFERSPSVIGRRVKFGGHEVTIVGVAPAGFFGIDVDANDAWLPASMYPGGGGFNNLPWYRVCCASFRVIARPATPGDEQQIITAGTNAIRPVRVPGWVYDSKIVITAGPILEALGPLKQSDDMRVATRIAGVVLLVLLIAVANVTNLLLLRTARRGHEIAVRRALGVSRERLFEQIAVEAIVVSLAGGITALLLALWAGTALRRLMLPSVHWADPVLDGRTIMLIVGMSILLGILCALAPTLEAMKRSLVASLRGGATRGAQHRARLRALLLGVQAALCVVLLIGAGLFLRSFRNVTSIGTGFDVANRLFLTPLFDDPAAHRADVGAALPVLAERLRAIDGVEGVAFMNALPIISGRYAPIFLPGHDSLPQLAGGEFGPILSDVSPRYFKAVGLRLIAGRDFSAADRENTQRVMIVSQRLASLYWPGENPIGKCLVMDKRDGPCTQVIGVAADAHRFALIELPSTQAYLPIIQRGTVPTQFVVHIRAGREGAVVRAADEIMRSLVSDLLMVSARRFDSVNDRELRPWKLGATLFGGLGALALVVAAIGVYSVVAYGVSRRTHEMGVRLALGAQRSNILDLVVGDGMRVVGVGILVGTGASIVFGRLIASLLFGVDVRDVSVHLIVVVVLIVVTATACLVPAWRASSVNPVDALRAD